MSRHKLMKSENPLQMEGRGGAMHYLASGHLRQS